MRILNCRWSLTAAIALLATMLSSTNASVSEENRQPEPYTEQIPGTDVTFEMLPIPGGVFTMGSPESEKDRNEDEGPQFEVEVKPFFMGKHEVTWGEYNLYLSNYARLHAAGVPPVPEHQWADAVTYPTPLYEQDAASILGRMGRGRNYPAVIMSQYAARQYAKWLSKKTGRFYRLPTETEWEYACRAGTSTAYSFGDDPAGLSAHGWFYDNAELEDGDVAYHKVGQKKPNPWGLHDMHGNVAEYVIDAYSPEWYEQFGGTRVSAERAVNWPKEVYPRLVRGGSYDSEAEQCRSASRAKVTEAHNVKDPQLPKSPHWMSKGFWIGFRLVSPMEEPSEEEKLKYWEADDPTTASTLRRDRERREVITPPQRP